MATVTITIKDTEEAQLDIKIEHSNREDAEITPANVLGETLYNFCDINQFSNMAFYTSKELNNKREQK